MDLQALNSPLPKNWLELSCHKLFCDEIIVTAGPSSTQAFAANSTNPIPLPVLATSLPDLVTISNPAYDNDVASYTAPTSQYVQFTWQMGVQSSSLNAVLSTQFSMRLNGATILPSLNRQTFVGNNATGYIISTALVRLAAGDVVTWRFDSSGVSGVWVCNPVSFTGLVV